MEREYQVKGVEFESSFGRIRFYIYIWYLWHKEHFNFVWNLLYGNKYLIEFFGVGERMFLFLCVF